VSDTLESVQHLTLPVAQQTCVSLFGYPQLFHVDSLSLEAMSVLGVGAHHHCLPHLLFLQSMLLVRVLRFEYLFDSLSLNPVGIDLRSVEEVSVLLLFGVVRMRQHTGR